MNISDSEWIILEILWVENPLPAEEIISRIPVDKNWKPNTTRTLINRLLKKEILDYHKSGRSFNYYPTYEKKYCINNRNKSFLKTIYGGVIKNMFAAFVEDFVVSDKEVEEIRTLLKKKENELKKGKD